MLEYYDSYLDLSWPEHSNTMGVILYLHDPVDGEILRSVVEELRVRFPYFYVMVACRRSELSNLLLGAVNRNLDGVAVNAILNGVGQRERLLGQYQSVATLDGTCSGIVVGHLNGINHVSFGVVAARQGVEGCLAYEVLKSAMNKVGSAFGVAVVHGNEDVTRRGEVLAVVNYAGTLLIGSDAGCRNGGDGLLSMIVVLFVHYESIEGDGIETCRVAVDGCVVGMERIVLTGVAIGLVGNLEEVGVGVTGLPLCVDAGHLSCSTLHFDEVAAAID